MTGGTSQGTGFPTLHWELGVPNTRRFWECCLEMVEFREDVISLPGDPLGIFPYLSGKDHRGYEKFLEYHDGMPFLSPAPVS